MPWQNIVFPGLHISWLPCLLSSIRCSFWSPGQQATHRKSPSCLDSTQRVPRAALNVLSCCSASSGVLLRRLADKMELTREIGWMKSTRQLLNPRFCTIMCLKPPLPQANPKVLKCFHIFRHPYMHQGFVLMTSCFSRGLLKGSWTFGLEPVLSSFSTALQHLRGAVREWD